MEMVPEFVITERKAGFFCFVLIVFIGSCLWMIPVEAGLEIGTRAGVSVSVCVCVCMYTCACKNAHGINTKAGGRKLVVCECECGNGLQGERQIGVCVLAGS